MRQRGSMMPFQIKREKRTSRLQVRDRSTPGRADWREENVGDLGTHEENINPAWELDEGVEWTAEYN